mmetsp:Transcript_55559/g.130127  ORF Transcript_55559/g.130127 Transcript_55559/m.130127 type:complete len:390 (+) Transcript_55559:321-1490(+)
MAIRRRRTLLLGRFLPKGRRAHVDGDAHSEAEGRRGVARLRERERRDQVGGGVARAASRRRQPEKARVQSLLARVTAVRHHSEQAPDDLHPLFHLLRFVILIRILLLWLCRRILGLSPLLNRDANHLVELELVLRPVHEVRFASHRLQVLRVRRAHRLKDARKLVRVEVDVTHVPARATCFGVSVEGNLAVQHLEHYDTNSPLVNLVRVHLGPHQELRRAVPQGQKLAVSHDLSFPLHRQAKVADLCVAVLSHEDVGRLHVLMDYTHGVDVLNCLQDLASPFANTTDWQVGPRLLDNAVDISAAVLHDQHASVIPLGEKPDNVGVVSAVLHDGDFLLETCDDILVQDARLYQLVSKGLLLFQNLQCNLLACSHPARVQDLAKRSLSELL